MKGRMLTPILLILCLCSSGASAGPADKGPTGDEIIKRHLEAAGGWAALAKFKSRLALGTVRKENEPDGRMAIMSESPNRLSAYYEFRDFTFRMVYDGKGAFIRPALPRQASYLTDKYQEMMASGLMYNGISLYNLLAASELGALKFEAKGTKKVGGRPAYVVQAKPSKGSALRLYFDAETYMWVRTDYGKASGSKEMGTFTNDVVNQGGAELSVDFYVETSDFREVDGLKLPFKFEQVMTAPILRLRAAGTVTGTIREYQHDVPIDPSMFR